MMELLFLKTVGEHIPAKAVIIIYHMKTIMCIE